MLNREQIQKIALEPQLATMRDIQHLCDICRDLRADVQRLEAALVIALQEKQAAEAERERVAGELAQARKAMEAARNEICNIHQRIMVGQLESSVNRIGLALTTINAALEAACPK